MPAEEHTWRSHGLTDLAQLLTGILNPQKIDFPSPSCCCVSSFPCAWVSLTSSKLCGPSQYRWGVTSLSYGRHWPFPQLPLFYSVSNLQVLEYLLLTLSGSLSYFRVNKSSLRHHTEHIQFVFMKNSPWKMGSIVYWLRLYSEPDSVQGHPSFAIHWTVWPWLSGCTSRLPFLLYPDNMGACLLVL